MTSLVKQVRDLGYRVSWSQGATPEPLREQQREAGWAWEGDTHANDGVPLQHDAPTAPGYVPADRVLIDDSDHPTIWFVEGPVTGGDVGSPTGFVYSDGTPVDVFLRFYLREDDEDAWRSLIASHEERLAELELRAEETPQETFERQVREAEERRAATADE